MLDQARSNGIIPAEQYSKKQSTAEDGSYDTNRYLPSEKERMSIVSADAVNFYNCVNHAIIAIIFLCLGVWGGSITTMLRVIQLMKFYLRTGWGNQAGASVAM